MIRESKKCTIRNICGIFTATAVLLSQLCLLIFSSSCSSHRLRYESLRENVRMEELENWKQLEDSIRSDWLNVRNLLRLNEENQQIWIWPEGEFSFQLDSGFVGSASVLLIEEIARSVQVEEDSELVRIDRVIQMDGGEERSELVQEIQHKSRKERVTNSSEQKALFRIILMAILLKVIIAWTGRYFEKKGK